MNLSALLRNSGKLLFPAVMFYIFNISAQTNTLNLDVGGATYKINKEIYGALLEQTSTTVYNGLYIGTTSSVPNVNGMRKDVIAAFKECGVTNLDWPGGCEAEKYDWKKGIGTKASRGNEMQWGLGTQEYFQLCDSVGSIPYVTANVRNQTPAYMAEWLNYMETNFPGKLKYWKMGNEPWGGCAAIGVPGISITNYSQIYKQQEAAIPQNLRGKIARIADGGTANGTAAAYWLDSLMKTSASIVDGVTLHYYSGFGSSNTQESYNFTNTEYYNRISSAWLIDRFVTNCENTMLKYDADYRIGLMVDEWGLWYAKVAGKNYTQSTCRDAVAASLHLNVFNNHCRRVKMASVAQPVNFIQPLVLTEAPAQPRIVKTPTFYVYKMYKVHQDAKMVPVTTTTPLNQSIPLVNASASVDGNGKLHISMCNTHPSAAQTVTVNLNNAPSYKQCTGTIVNGESMTSYNDFGVEERVNIKNFSDVTLSGKTITVKLPAHSVVTLELIADNVKVNENVSFNNRAAFTINVIKNGQIKLDYDAPENSRFSIELYNLHGRKALESYNGTVRQMHGSLVWKPVSGLSGTNVYIVKATFGNITKSQCFMLNSVK